MKDTRSLARGIAAIVMSAFGFALMAMCVRLADDFGAAVSSFEKSFFRNLIALAIAAAVYCRRRSRADAAPAPRRLPPALWLRALLGTVGIFANFYALGHVTIAEAQTLNKTAPFFTVVFAWLFLRERVRPRRLLAVAIAFVGVVLVAKPGFAGESGFALAMGLLGGVAAGGAYACLRGLAEEDVDPSFIVLFFSAFSCLASVPFILVCFDPLVPAQVLILLAAGAAAALGQFGITWAYRFASPRDIAVYDYTNILFTAALGYLVFGQVPDAVAVVGMAVIVFAALATHFDRN